MKILILMICELRKKIIEADKRRVYCVIIAYSASLLEACSESFIKKLFELKKKYKFKIIFDEVFTGFFKSKEMFYFQNFKNISPDIICLSKTLGGGKSSISCLVIDDNTYDEAYGKINDTFLHTTTYNGFGEESVTALAALNELSKTDFKKKVENLSNLLTSKLSDLYSKYPNKIDKVKGNGILNGIVFKSYPTQIAEILEKIPSNFIKDKSFLKKLSLLQYQVRYKKFNILTAINTSSYLISGFLHPLLWKKKM